MIPLRDHSNEQTSWPQNLRQIKVDVANQIYNVCKHTQTCGGGGEGDILHRTLHINEGWTMRQY